MCIAIYHPAGHVLPDHTLENCFENNGDGCGFAYVNEDNKGVKRMMIKKTLDFPTFLRQYQRATRVNPESPFLLHFRIRTHGATDKSNCHPFQIDDDHVFVHNGIIGGMTVSQQLSDTQMFNIDYLQHLEADWMRNEGVTRLIEKVINNSKLIVLNKDLDVMIYNETKGDWVGDCWFSNDSYKKRVPYKSNWQAANRDKNTPAKKPAELPWYQRNNLFGWQGKEPQTNTRVYYTKWAHIECDVCGSENSADTNRFFYYLGEVTSLCKDCVGGEIEDNFGSEAYEEVSCSCYLDWRNSEDDSYNRLSKYFSMWKNPWGDEVELDTSGYLPTQEDMEDFNRQELGYDPRYDA